MTVSCTNPTCAQHNIPKDVTAYVESGGDISVLTCGECGQPCQTTT
jgi:transcription elongation factor Elf1